ncbi:hypothetical protein N0V93_002190 [Gnomoniopsis smithogilvyi]|uniref:Uncharacterized protein n=1 Tax=Gnomoniopsis smithogilvyi TaxID=1191159 RepID=A0A9W8YW88_9PEZI|nr:hypothetical protein N0V93_002190 [Gnomoniopsis smithogilvyi]
MEMAEQKITEIAQKGEGLGELEEAMGRYNAMSNRTGSLRSGNRPMGGIFRFDGGDMHRGQEPHPNRQPAMRPTRSKRDFIQVLVRLI